MEAVMARRLWYYAETYHWLPDTHFGGRPGRTTEQALLLLTNSADKTMVRDMTATLITFDLKGSFNGVHGNTLEAWLKRTEGSEPGKGMDSKLHAGRNGQRPV